VEEYGGRRCVGLVKDVREIKEKRKNKKGTLWERNYSVMMWKIRP